MEKESTFGEKAIGFTFNPSGNENVNIIKKHYAEIIDILNDLRNSPVVEGMPNATERNRHCSIAITDAETAQMRAVKAITWK